MAATDLHLQGMEDIITCSICQELFTDARSLTCKHCFCYQCLIEFQTTFTRKPCPLCREETVPAARELRRLPVNKAVNDMVGLVMKHKGEFFISSASCVEWVESFNISLWHHHFTMLFERQQVFNQKSITI